MQFRLRLEPEPDLKLIKKLESAYNKASKTYRKRFYNQDKTILKNKNKPNSASTKE